MYTAFLLTFLPTQFQAQYWFINGNQDHFTLEVVFTSQDFIFIDQYNSYFLVREIIDDLHAFLVLWTPKESDGYYTFLLSIT
jgi:hypothetical protein